MFKKLTISLDVDDVLFPCMTAAIEEVNRRYGLNLDVRKLTTWEFDNFNEEERACINTVFKDVTFYEQQQPLEGAVEMVQTLVDWGHDVIFLSATSGVIMTTRAQSLRTFFSMIPERNIMLGSRKDLVRTDIHLDDAMHNIISSIAQYPVIQQQLWNISDPRFAGYLSVANYDEFLSLVRRFSQLDTPMGKRHSREPNIVCLVGPSGSNKTALAHELVKNPSYAMLRSCTTRPRAVGEGDNLYRFIGVDEFEQGRGDFIEQTQYAGHYYGLRVTDAAAVLDQGLNAVLMADINGALAMRQKYGSRASLVFVHRDKYEVIKDLVARDISVEDRARRIQNLEREYESEALCDYTVLANTSVGAMAEKVIHSIE